MEFFLPMIPPTATHQEKKWRVVKGKPVSYDPPEVVAARSKLTGYLAGHKPARPLDGAVRLLVKWCFPRGQHEDGEYRTSKPDTDNLNKLLKDCMTAVGFWKDDAQVASEICEKFWAEVPGIYICVTELCEERAKRKMEPSTAELALAALRAQKNSNTLDRSSWEGCDMCATEYDREDWRDGAAHDLRIDDDCLFYFDHRFGWEGVKVNFCPNCGRPLTEEAWEELERRIRENDGTTD